MKTILLILFVIALVVMIVVFKNKSVTPTDIMEYTLQGKNYKLLIADNQEEWERGLMFVRGEKDFDGMIFLFPDYQTRTFWNKNTFMDLEVYWLKDDEVLGISELPSIEKTKEIKVITSPQEVNKVIEIFSTSPSQTRLRSKNNTTIFDLKLQGREGCRVL